MKNFKKYFHQYLAKPLYEIIKPLQPILNLKKRTFVGKFKFRINDELDFWIYNNLFDLETKLFWEGGENSIWEKFSRIIWSHFSQVSNTIFDIGANTGIYSLYSKTYNRNAMVYAFEPQPNIFSILEKNNNINRYDILCYQLAISQESSKLPFYNTGQDTFLTKNTTVGSLNKEWRLEDQYSIMVESLRLDDFILKYDILKIDLIKIDVESYEFEVLKGYDRFLFIHRPVILVEIQNFIIGQNIYEYFVDNDYNFYWINEEVGLVEVKQLGYLTKKNNWNYLLVPKEKSYLCFDFIIK